ncbi:Alginate biosynthesis sensor protein KinB [Candidatus Magnetaquicoccaceae bacterium FCR-1]|uniref:histidine kinase n=1 Tax=Candidatus Magnetaquiglobus chichijimensis TaxID=3141448 RepID=A0ABQ0CB66_9PROT
MKLHTRVLLAQSPLVLALVGLGGVAVVAISYLGENSQRMFWDNYLSVQAMQRFKESVERLDVAALFRLLGRQEESQRMIRAQLPLMEQSMHEASLHLVEPGEQEALDRLSERWNFFSPLLEQFSALPLPGPAENFYFDRLYPEFLTLKMAANALVDINQNAMVFKSDHVGALSHWLNSLMLITALVSVAMGFALSWVLSRLLMRPLTVLTLTARRLGNGDHAARAQISGVGEMAELAMAFNGMADRLDQFRRGSEGQVAQAWRISRAVIDSLPDPVLVLDTAGVLIASNVASSCLIPGSGDWRAHLDASLREAIERQWCLVVSGQSGEASGYLSEAVAVSCEHGLRWFLPHALPLHGEEGIAGVTLLLRDVTRFRRFDALREDLISTVAHEFRTPLTSLHMAIHLCLDRSVGTLSATQEELLGTARRDCHRMQAMVDDLLDLSRIQSGRIALQVTPTLTDALLRDVADRHAIHAVERGMTLLLAPNAVSRTVQVDRERLGIALSNLVSNAVHHSGDGCSILLDCLDEDREVRFLVRDSGQGIPEMYREQVFERFFRVPGTRAEGTGLGLSITREIVAAHGGRLGVSSDQDGCSFWFTIPV